MCVLHRFSQSLPRIKSLLTHYSGHMDMELQQRAVEYSAIFNKHDNMRYADISMLALTGAC